MCVCLCVHVSVSLSVLQTAGRTLSSRCRQSLASCSTSASQMTTRRRCGAPTLTALPTHAHVRKRTLAQAHTHSLSLSVCQVLQDYTDSTVKAIHNGEYTVQAPPFSMLLLPQLKHAHAHVHTHTHTPHTHARTHIHTHPSLIAHRSTLPSLPPMG